MVAHNAKFDVSFLEMAYKKYNLGTFKNPVIDTLELSRTMDNTYARHSLSALVKRYNVPWEEDAHHRADYDAEGTALVFAKIISKLVSQKFTTISSLDKLVSKDEIHKFGRTYHETGWEDSYIIATSLSVGYKFPIKQKSTKIEEGVL